MEEAEEASEQQGASLMVSLNLQLSTRNLQLSTLTFTLEFAVAGISTAGCFRCGDGGAAACVYVAWEGVVVAWSRNENNKLAPRDDSPPSAHNAAAPAAKQTSSIGAPAASDKNAQQRESSRQRLFDVPVELACLAVVVGSPSLPALLAILAQASTSR